MDPRSVVSALAGILMFLGFVPYIIAICRRTAEPAKATWLIWSGLDIITAVGMHLENSLNGQIVGASIGATTTFFLTMIYGTSKWSRLDIFCIVGAIIGIILMFTDPKLGMITGLVVITIGSVPTFVSAWRDPSKEDKLAWTVFWISCVLATVTVPTWDVENASQPITFLLIESTMMYLLYIQPRIRPKNSA